jgi:hypothetical protein
VVSRRQADSSRWLGERPSLEYQHAFDLCAVETHQTGGSVVVFASSPFYARELLKRLDSYEARLVPIGGWEPPSTNIGKLLGPEVEHPDVKTLESLTVQTESVVWAEPERESGEQVLKHIHQMLLPRGHLHVIASGWLARFLPEWQRNEDRPGERLVGLRQTTKWLRQSGFTIEARYGFHGPVSILWGYAFRMMERLGRGDLADRCLFKMRAEYVVSGWQAFWVPVGLAVARTK